MEARINVAQLLKEAVGANRVLELDGPELELEGEGPAHVRASLRLTRTDRGVWVSGPAAISVEGVCSRCLVPFGSWVDVDLDEVFVQVVDVTTGARIRYRDDLEGEPLTIDAHHVLDLTELLRQYRIAAMPLAPVCREDCRGICTRCGTDLNESSCACEPELDPRWAKLRELLA